MKILWLCPFVPYPLDNGGNIRVFSMLAHLSHLHDIHLVCLDSAMQGGKDLQPLKQLCSRVDVLAEPPFLPLKLHHAPNFFSEAPGSLVVGGGRLKRELEAIVSGHPYDLLHVEFLTLAELALDLEVPLRTCTEHFFAVESYAHNLEEMHGIKRWYFQRELNKLRRWEPATLSRFNHVFVTSEPHRRQVAEWMGRDDGVTLVPNGVDTDYFRPQETQVNPHAFFFMGAFHLDASSQRALAVLVDVVFPAILEKLPDAELHVVGKGVPDTVSDRAHANIHFHGYVDDVRPYLAASVAMLLPIIGGSGTKLRILSAMAMGKPVITSMDGLAGLDCSDGEELFIASDWPDMVDKALLLTGDEGLRTQMGEAARQVMVARFSWAHLAALQHEVWLGLR